jgi:AI-2 transport protein TqsA
MLGTVTSEERFRFLVSAAAVVVIIGGLRSAAGVLDPLLMAGVVVACAAPLQERLRRRGLPRGWAMAVTAITVVLALLAFVVLLGYAGKALVDTVPRYQDRLTALVTSGAAWLDARGIDASTSKLLQLVNPAKVIGMASSLAQGVGGAMSEALLIVMLSVFLLIESAAFWRRRGGPSAAMKGAARTWQHRFEAMASDVQQYVWITMLTGVIYAVAVWIVMLVLGTDLPVLWAIVALVLSFVPGIGFALSMIPPAALTLLEFGGTRTAILIVLFVILNNIVDNVIKPRFMKDGFDLGPFVMFASVLFWAFVLGPTGGLLAIPLTTAVRRLAFPERPADDVTVSAPIDIIA